MTKSDARRPMFEMRREGVKKSRQPRDQYRRVGGLVSQFFLPFALTVTYALLASLLCAITVVPVLAYFLVDRVKVDVDPETGEPAHSIWVNVYTPTIRFVLSRRATKWGVIALAAVLFVGSFALLVVMIGTAFFYGFGTIFKPVIEEFGWTNAEVSLAFSLRSEIGGIAAPLSGVMIDRFGPRKSLLSGVVVAALGVFGLAMSKLLNTCGSPLRTLPVIGGNRPAISFAKVDLPLPFWPSSAMRSSWSILRSSPRRIGAPSA